MVRLIVCLTPAILVCLIAAFLVPNGGDDWIGVAMILIVIGALISGFCVSQTVYRGLRDPVWAQWLLSIITFVCVALAYVGIGLAGCCGIAAGLS